MSAYHTPIMAQKVTDLLALERGGIFIDGTLGGGGHAEAVLKLLPAGSRLIGIDRDADALKEAQMRLAPFGEMFTALKGNFFHMKELLTGIGVHAVNGVLLDLGVSSHQLDTAHRGFSYHQEAPLDMRMDGTQRLTAGEVVNTYSKEALARIFRDYGEERYASRIAGAILRERERGEIKTTTALADIIKKATPPKMRYEGKHPARRVFQAIRIEVNGELEGLGAALEGVLDILAPGGRLLVITFHSLEDRIVKLLFRGWENPCTCPKSAPVCICAKKALARGLTRKPLVADDREREENMRARSAKLRAVEKTHAEG